GLTAQLGRYGTGRARLAAKHRQSLSLPALVPPLWILWLAVGAMISFAVPKFVWLYFASLILYAAIILGGSLWLARRQSLKVGLRRAVVAEDGQEEPGPGDGEADGGRLEAERLGVPGHDEAEKHNQHAGNGCGRHLRVLQIVNVCTNLVHDSTTKV